MFEIKMKLTETIFNEETGKFEKRTKRELKASKFTIKFKTMKKIAKLFDLEMIKSLDFATIGSDRDKIFDIIQKIIIFADEELYTVFAELFWEDGLSYDEFEETDIEEVVNVFLQVINFVSETLSDKSKKK